MGSRIGGTFVFRWQWLQPYMQVMYETRLAIDCTVIRIKLFIWFVLFVLIKYLLLLRCVFVVRVSRNEVWAQSTLILCDSRILGLVVILSHISIPVYRFYQFQQYNTEQNWKINCCVFYAGRIIKIINGYLTNHFVWEIYFIFITIFAGTAEITRIWLVQLFLENITFI